MEEKKFYTINMSLIPIKLHYFFMFGGFGGDTPFISILGKGLGISATAVGLCNTSLTMLVLLFKPFLGTLVDYFRNIKLFLICLLLMKAASSLCLLLLPPIDNDTQEPLKLKLVFKNISQGQIDLPSTYCKTCIEKTISTSGINCTGEISYKPDGEFRHLVEVIQFEEIISTYVQKENFSGEVTGDEMSVNYVMNLYSKDSLGMNVTNQTQIKVLSLKCNPDIHPCILNIDTPPELEYVSYQFWVFALVVILTGLGTGNASTLSDVACYEILGEKRDLYGRQRLYGTIGWALICSLSGVLSDLMTGDKEIIDYSPGFYIMALLLLTDTFILCRVPMTKVKLSTNICGDLRRVFYTGEIMLFAVGAVAVGCLTASVTYFEFWYLQDLGATQTMLGGVTVVQCLLSEAPFFFVSGWIVEKLGCFNCLVGSFIAFAVRFWLYSIITNPWWALLIDATHGFTFAMFHDSMTTFASFHAPEGVEGTMFGIFGGLTEGLGQTIGSLLTGAAFDKFGGRRTFSFASLISVICAVLFTILPRIVRRCSTGASKEDIIPSQR